MEKQYKNKICKFCYKEFIPNRNNQQYCINCGKLYYKLYRLKNPEKVKLSRKTYYYKNSKKENMRVKIWKNKNKDKIREQNRIYARYYYNKNRIKSSYRINNNMRKNIAISLNGTKNGRSWEKLVGYTIKDLIIHLENQFDKKMNWDNYGSYWEIDHKIPQSWFRFLTSQDKGFKECWALNNLQPLEKKENNKKNNRYSS